MSTGYKISSRDVKIIKGEIGRLFWKEMLFLRTLLDLNVVFFTYCRDIGFVIMEESVLGFRIGKHVYYNTRQLGLISENTVEENWECTKKCFPLLSLRSLWNYWKLLNGIISSVLLLYCKPWLAKLRDSVTWILTKLFGPLQYEKKLIRWLTCLPFCLFVCYVRLTRKSFDTWNLESGVLIDHFGSVFRMDDIYY